ncbi:MAG: hypothetical protein RSG23_08635 [Gordonibacter sp.]|uniref:hypothetical protein n=1 Tax=Gordonibacter sp. TaxID=1968902 RepID=UPI002FC58211
MPFNPTLEELSKALGVKEKPESHDFHTWGVAKSVNAGGTAEVALNLSKTATCSVPKNIALKTGDRVLVCVMRDGSSAVINAY